MSDPLAAIRPKNQKDVHAHLDSLPVNPVDIIQKMQRFNDLSNDCEKLCFERVMNRLELESGVQYLNKMDLARAQRRFENLAEMCAPMCSRSAAKECGFGQ